MIKHIEIKRYMRFSQQEKHEIIRLVEGSDLSTNRTIRKLAVHIVDHHITVRKNSKRPSRSSWYITTINGIMNRSKI